MIRRNALPASRSLGHEFATLGVLDQPHGDRLAARELAVDLQALELAGPARHHQIDVAHRRILEADNRLDVGLQIDAGLGSRLGPGAARQLAGREEGFEKRLAVVSRARRLHFPDVVLNFAADRQTRQEVHRELRELEGRQLALLVEVNAAGDIDAVALDADILQLGAPVGPRHQPECKLRRLAGRFAPSHVVEHQLDIGQVYLDIDSLPGCVQPREGELHGQVADQEVIDGKPELVTVARIECGIQHKRGGGTLEGPRPGDFRRHTIEQDLATRLERLLGDDEIQSTALQRHRAHRLGGA